MTLFGELSLWVAVLMAAWSTMVSFAGGVQRNARLAASGARAVYATLAFLILAALGLFSALLRSDFTLAYVASQTSANLPTPYKFGAFWAGQSGSLLVWSLALAACAAAAVWSTRRHRPELAPYVAGTLSAMTLLILLISAFGSYPYERLAWPVPDGQGMLPRLQHPSTLFHSPNLYVGFGAAAVPFALAVAAVVTRRLDAEWLGAMRRWALLSWCFLTIGLLVGVWWGYAVVGWVPVWEWHPAASAAVLPWLTGTAFLHSVTVQEKRGMLRTWSVTLVIATFLLTVVGALGTSAASVASVPSLPKSAGYWLAAGLVAGIGVSAYLVHTRLRELEPPARLERQVSREGGLLLGSLLLAAAAGAVYVDSLLPSFGRAVGNETPGAGPFQPGVSVALVIAIVALMGVGPLIGWRRSSSSTLRRQLGASGVAGAVAGVLLFALGMRDGYALLTYMLCTFVAGTIVQVLARGVVARRAIHGGGRAAALVQPVTEDRQRYGGSIAHLGIVVLAAALAGQPFRRAFDVSLSPGETFTTTDPFGQEWSFSSNGVSRFQQLNRHVTAVAVRAARSGRGPNLITTETRQYFDRRGVPTYEPVTAAGILGTWRQDVFVVLAGVRGDERADLRVTFNPLVRWVWVGGAIVVIGGLVVLWPRTAPRRLERSRAVATHEPAVRER
ncbi:MAG TPA: cytochrome c-type biogenesis CcmF C-terminal domain-containing protein [Gemmatimonadaceae bacterium]|nr:cytochrome c-type biogenesis CcmF C-terminal domain-containing protein [Gemmatimonadaceae bacterium]